MDDAVTRFMRATEANDIDAVMETLSPDAELVSPISGRMVFRGTDDVRTLLTAVYGTLRGLRWDEQMGDGAVRAVVGEAAVGPIRLTDAMVFDLAADGRIRRVRPHLRPWLALTLFALVLGPKVGRHPGIVAARRCGRRCSTAGAPRIRARGRPPVLEGPRRSGRDRRRALRRAGGASAPRGLLRGRRLRGGAGRVAPLLARHRAGALHAGALRRCSPRWPGAWPAGS